MRSSWLEAPASLADPLPYPVGIAPQGARIRPSAFFFSNFASFFEE